MTDELFRVVEEIEGRLRRVWDTATDSRAGTNAERLDTIRAALGPDTVSSLRAALSDIKGEVEKWRAEVEGFRFPHELDHPLANQRTIEVERLTKERDDYALALLDFAPMVPPDRWRLVSSISQAALGRARAALSTNQDEETP